MLFQINIKCSNIHNVVLAELGLTIIERSAMDSAPAVVPLLCMTPYIILATVGILRCPSCASSWSFCWM